MSRAVFSNAPRFSVTNRESTTAAVIRDLDDTYDAWTSEGSNTAYLRASGEAGPDICTNGLSESVFRRCRLSLDTVSSPVGSSN